MSDEVDRAQDFEFAHRDRALAGVLDAAAQLHARQFAEVCGCGEEIEEARRRAVPGAKTCIHCATHIERTARLYRSR